MKILFAGTPDFAVPSLKALAACHDVVAVYTQPDRPAGRGRKLRASPVKQQALERLLPVHQPTSLRAREVQGEMAALRPDVMVVVAYGLILPKAVLAIPVHGCLNVHASLLPRWRGAAPIQRAMLAGDTETGVSIMQMEEGLDTGPVLYRHLCPIHPEDTAHSLENRLALLGASSLLAVLDDLTAFQKRACPQAATAVCYAPKIDKSGAMLDWQLPAVQLARQVRAFNPRPVAFTSVGGLRLRVWEASGVVDAQAAPSGVVPGTILAVDRQGIRVATGEGALCITRVQQEGGNALPVSVLLNARPAWLQAGARLG